MEFEEVYRLYFRDVYRYLLSVTGDESLAEELTQESFVRALRSLPRFDGQKDIRAWLFTIAKNAWLSRRRGDKHLTGEPPPESVPGSDPPLEDTLADRERAQRIHQYLHGMRQPYKEVFTLRVFGELPFEQIGALFGKSDGWARTVFYRAKVEILEYMEGMERE